jgi:hypothetical protein
MTNTFWQQVERALLVRISLMNSDATSWGYVLTSTSDKAHHPVRSHISAHCSLVALLQSGANASLRYHHDETLTDYLAQQIEEAITEHRNPARVREVVQSLIANLDYRLVADYLHALRADDAPLVNAFENLVSVNSVREMNRLLYDLARLRFSSTSPPSGDGNSVFVGELKELFSRCESGLIIYLGDRALQSPLAALLNSIGPRLGSYIEQQYDLPSRNALVRQGVVKKWVLPDGTAIVSKRDNHHKPGRFKTEQLNCEAILKKLFEPFHDRLLLGRTDTGAGIWLRVIRPFAIMRDGYSEHYYALSVWTKGDSLEELLLDEDHQATRRAYLTHYRWMFDALYDRGVLWGDMSPRNIIVEHDGQDIIYHILDFEKTRIIAGPATTAERIAHCRGQICVEELGVVCPPAEVEECFRGYFAPAAWDLASDAGLSFAQRPEVASILRGRGLRDVTLGLYNQTDLEIRSVRTPDTHPATGQRRFPGHLNFKIEHYLSCANYDDASDYDRQTTEILIAAKRHGCFDAIVDVLTQDTDDAEGEFIKAEFGGILDSPSVSRVMPPKNAVDNLVHTINALNESRERADDFRSLCRCLSLNRRI